MKENKKILVLLTFLIVSNVHVSIAKQVPKDTEKQIPTKESKRYMIDETGVFIYGPERDHIVCKSEIDRLSIDGRKLTKESLITEELLYQETIKYKVPVDEAIVDRYLGNIQKEHKLSLDQVKDIFKSAGYTYFEGRNQLRMLYASQVILDNKIRSRLIVPEQEVIAYYNANPIIKEPKYLLEVGFVPTDRSLTMLKQKTTIQESIKTGKAIDAQWREPFWIRSSDIAEGLLFVTTMKPGDISQPTQVAGGFELYRLKDKKPERLVPLEKRYHEIVSHLQRPVFERMFNEYKKELYNNAYVVDFTA